MSNCEVLYILSPRIIFASIVCLFFGTLCLTICWYDNILGKRKRYIVKRRKRVTFNDEAEIIYPKRVNRLFSLTSSIQFGQIGDRVVAKWPKFKSRPQGGPWFSGMLDTIDLDKRSCIIHYDDGQKAEVEFEDIWIAPNAPTDVGKNGKKSVELNGDGGNHRYSDLKKMLKSYSKQFAVYRIMFDEE
tara:strand:+ start:953 stop:1513 length:561 start_codon:yes stop_codon:yes gene_type:complete